ncbi:hypothetical protein AGMMS49959_05420 [Planctomycetales bacterium]|nr:hypothetical protein AGMMS49959_05420 [Planctomycetales bacterium]
MMGGYRLAIAKRAEKFIERQPAKQQTRLLQAISGLPTTGDIKPLAGIVGGFRLRVGDYRVIYEFDALELTVKVKNIGNRGDVYK